MRERSAETLRGCDAEHAQSAAGDVRSRVAGGGRNQVDVSAEQGVIDSAEPLKPTTFRSRKLPPIAFVKSATGRCCKLPTAPANPTGTDLGSFLRRPIRSSPVFIGEAEFTVNTV